jgi:hypothetical protein
MAKKKYKCSKCNRTFVLAAHLARHNNAIHGKRAGGKTGAKKRRKKAVRKAARRVMAVRATAPRGTAGLLRGMKAFHTSLANQLTALEAEKASIAEAIEAMGGAATKTRVTVPAKRGRQTAGTARPGSLKDRMVKFLRAKGTPQSPKQIAAGLLKAGYKTKSKNLATAVRNALPQTKGVKKVGFGQYRA